MDLLTNTLHIAERVENSLAIILGRNFESFRKEISAKIERKFIFVEPAENYTDGGEPALLKFHPFCPNCTEKATWPRKVVFGWKDGVGVIRPSSSDNPFSSCCDPLHGKTLKIACSVSTPGLIP